jgi:hypothetical protein
MVGKEGGWARERERVRRGGEVEEGREKPPPMAVFALTRCG